LQAVLRHPVRQLLIYVVLSFVAKWHATLHPMREDKGRQKSKFLERGRERRIPKVQVYVSVGGVLTTNIER
jgi:hypothetical protein